MTDTQPIVPGTDLWAGHAFAASFALTILVLLSWLTGSWEIWSFGLGYVPMAPSTALLLGAIAAGGWIRQRRFASRSANQLARIVSAGVCIASTVVLVQQLAGIEIIRLVTSGENVGNVPVGLISPLTAGAIALASASLALQTFHRRAFRSVGAALALGVGFFGTIVVLSYLLEAPLYYGGRIVPMALSTAITLVVLAAGLLLASGSDTWPLNLIAVADHRTTAVGLIGRGFLALLIVAFSLIVVVAVTYIRHERAETRLAATETISAIADLKVGLIDSWLAERLGDAEVFSKAPMRDELTRLELGTASDDDRRDLTLWLGAMTEAYGYEYCALVERDGSVRLAVGSGQASIDVATVESCHAALRENRVVARGFYRQPATQRMFLDLAVPFNDDQLSLVLLLRTDAEKRLLPQFSHWPTNSRTGETLVFTREGDSILFMNVLRTARDGGHEHLRPLAGLRGTPTERAVNGASGVIEAPDYRGNPVLAAIRPIHGMPWFLVAKIDRREVYASFRRQIGLTALAVAVMALAVAIGVRMLWYRSGLVVARRELESERQIRQAARNFRALFDQAAIGVAQIEASSGRIVAANRRFSEIVGYPQEEVVSLTADAIVYPGDRDSVREISRRLINGEASKLSQECGYVRKDGRVLVVHQTVSPLWDPGDEPRHYVVVVRDVTQEKETAKALETRDKLLVEVGRIAKVGGWEFDPVTSEGTWTPEVARIHDLDPDLGTNVAIGLSYYDGADREAIDRAVREAVELGRDYDLELQMTTATGARKWVHTVGRPTIENGRVVRVSGSIQDVTDRRRAEDEVSELNRELEARVASRTAELEAARSEQEAFSYSVSHDLRAPLRGIDGWSAALLEDCSDRLDEKGREFLGRVRSETQKMGRLIDDLLKLSRITRQEMRVGPVDLSALARSIAAKLRESDPGRDMQFVVEPGLVADCDAGLMEVVLTNLLENAWKFTRKCSAARVEFGCRVEDGVPVHFVRDNGAGFDMQYASRLFAPFQRMHTESEFPGSGIGLATVRRIVARHGGTIRAESEVDRGTTIYFTLGGTP
ncbi:MAG: PAS domain S-box protein [Thermoanaerobaculia bacterium]|jgi:PAS domain S-box-containing protein